MTFLFRLLAKPFKAEIKVQPSLLPKLTLKATSSLNKIQILLNEGADLFAEYMSVGRTIKQPHEVFNREYANRHFEEHQRLNGYQTHINTAKENRLLQNEFNAHILCRQEETWTNLETEYPRVAEIKTLKKQWMRHASYSHFTPETLLSAASLLNHLKSLIKDAHARALKCQTKKNHETIKLYINYLNQYKALIATQERGIHEAVYVRITTALATGEPQNNDPLVHLLTRLNRLHINLLNAPYMPLKTPLSLKRAYNYLQKQGSPALKKLVQEKLVLRSNGLVIPLIVFPQTKRTVLIPQSFATIIPKKPARFPFLFKKHQVRYNFFMTQEDLFFKLASINNLETTTPSWDFNDTYWKGLIEAQVHLTQEIKSLPVKKDVFVLQWSSFLYQQKKELISRQITYLSTLKATPPLLCSLENSQPINEIHAQFDSVFKACEADIASIRDKSLRAIWRNLKKGSIVNACPLSTQNTFEKCTGLMGF